MTADEVRETLRKIADPERAEKSKRFFKTGKGQYGEGDHFIGVSAPQLREVAKSLRGIELTEVLGLLKSSVHEERLLAVILLVDLYQRSKKDPKAQERVVQAYLRKLKYVNNWDLVDTSAPKILGNWLLSRDRGILYEQIVSKNLWTRRVAMVATQELIRHCESEDALALAELLLDDEEDLMHKAAGWMLREVGQKCSLVELREFLKKNVKKMPRTMLRYSIEKLPPEERKMWLAA